MKFLLLILLGTILPVLHAFDVLVPQDLVGKTAPDFSATSTIEETEFRKLRDFAGDVIVLRFTCT